MSKGRRAEKELAIRELRKQELMSVGYSEKEAFQKIVAERRAAEKVKAIVAIIIMGLVALALLLG